MDSTQGNLIVQFPPEIKAEIFEYVGYNPKEIKG
jgi:hypothetical protein